MAAVFVPSLETWFLLDMVSFPLKNHQCKGPEIRLPGCALAGHEVVISLFLKIVHFKAKTAEVGKDCNSFIA